MLKEAKEIIARDRFAVPLYSSDPDLKGGVTTCQTAPDVEACTNANKKKIGLWTNPLTSAQTTANNGISRDVKVPPSNDYQSQEIIELMDFVSVLAHSRHDESLTGRSIAAELRAQELVYRPAFRHLEKIYVILGFGTATKGTDISHQFIKEVSDYVRCRGYRGVSSWQNGADQRSTAYIKQVGVLIAPPDSQADQNTTCF